MEMPWQYFAVLLPVRTVGVQGDVRAYGHTIAVRAVQSYDAMTAQASEMPWAVQQRISRRITNELKEDINRVVYDVTDKPPGAIEGEKWCRGRGLNPRPPDYESGALPTTPPRHAMRRTAGAIKGLRLRRPF